MLEQRQRILEAAEPAQYVKEYADLSDGRRVILRDDRGWAGWPRNGLDSKWKIPAGREFTSMTMFVLAPDEVDTDEVWEGWVVERLRFLGVEVDPVSVHQAPFHVEFGPLIDHQLRQLNSNVDLVSESGGDRSVVEIVTFGAFCELDYCSDPLWSPTDAGGYTYSEQANYWSAEQLHAQRREMIDLGMREFRTQEFAALSDGRCVVLRDDRRWEFWPLNEPGSAWRFANGRELTRQTISMLEPADLDEWLDWTIRRLDGMDIRVNPATAHAAPFKVEFGTNVQHELRQRKPEN